jgi:hypothetical protein
MVGDTGKLKRIVAAGITDVMRDAVPAIGSVEGLGHDGSSTTS